MKTIYFVTEGNTDQIVLEELVAEWLDGEDFISRPIQPLSSDYATDLESNLSEGWRGVLAWCRGEQRRVDYGRDKAIQEADCLFIHIDADVAKDRDFNDPTFQGSCPPAQDACDWVRNHLIAQFGAELPANVVLCVPAQDLESWVLCALHPDIADQYSPIECRSEPGSLLVQLAPHKLVRRKDGRLRKESAKYRKSVNAIVRGWHNCVDGQLVNARCPEAVRFEMEARNALGR
jgi:hypothetical protein